MKALKVLTMFLLPLSLALVVAVLSSRKGAEVPPPEDGEAPDSLTIILPEPATLGNRKVKHIVVEFFPKEQK